MRTIQGNQGNLFVVMFISGLNSLMIVTTSHNKVHVWNVLFTWSWSKSQMTPETWPQLRIQTGTVPVKRIHIKKMSVVLLGCVYHSENKAWLLKSLSLHHLKHIHYTLSLAAINGSSYGTEHPRPADSVTIKRIVCCSICYGCMLLISTC